MLEFKEINVDRDRALCIRFRADSFVVSFGSADRFFAEAGPGGQDYLNGLRHKNLQIPGSCAHGWLDGRIVAQAEIQRDPHVPERGYVLLYYLVPELRGSGAGVALDAHVRQVLWAAGFRTSQLRVSATNGRAIAYYRKCGWRDLGIDPGHAGTRTMEREVLSIYRSSVNTEESP